MAEKTLTPEEMKKEEETIVLIGKPTENIPQTTDMALAKGVHHLTNDDVATIKLMSELPGRKRAACANCLVQASYFHDDVLRDFVHEYLRVGVSCERRGRKEIVHVVSTVKQEQTKQGMLARIRGFMGSQPM